MAFTAGQILRASQLGPVPCTSSTRPANPHSGQLIVESDTGTVLIYSGAAWRPLCATGEVSHYHESNSLAVQTLTSGTDQRIQFTTDNVTTALVTKASSGTGHTFTLNRAGIWSVYTTLRWASANTGIRIVAIRETAGGQITSQGGIQAAANNQNNHATVTRYFASGTILDVAGYQDSGANRDLQVDNGTGWSRIGLTWLGS